MSVFRDFLDISERQQAVGWRRRRDSNPRYGNSPYGGLANRWFQPLTHVSGSGVHAGSAGYISAFRKLQPDRQLFRNHVQPHAENHLFAGFKHAHAELRPLLLRGIERGIGMSDRLGDEESAFEGRVDLEETRVGR